jgi:hypothetical protein
MTIRFVVGRDALRTGLIYRVTPLGITDLSGQHFVPNVGGDITEDPRDVRDNDIEGEWSEAGLLEHQTVIENDSSSGSCPKRVRKGYTLFKTSESSKQRIFVNEQVKNICEV